MNCYAPTEDSTESAKNTFYRSLNKQINIVKKNQKIICIGDFNASTSAAWTNSSLREGSVINDLIVNNNGERFHEFFNHNQLSVLNTWFTHKRCRRVTWHSPDGFTKKAYDFILCCSWLRQFVTNCRVYNSYDFDSDHRLVVTNLTTPCTKKARFLKRKKSSRGKKLNFDDVTHEMTEQFRDSVIRKLNITEVNQSQSNTFLNDSIVNAMKESADTTFPSTPFNRHSPPWRSDAKLQELFTTKTELVAKNAPPESLARIRKKIRLHARFLKNEHFKSEAEKINMFAINKDLEKLFSRAKTQETTLRPTDNTCSSDKLMNHFKAHFNPEDPSNVSTPEELLMNNDDLPIFVKELQNISDGIDINDTPPTVEEIQKHVLNLKNNKANNDIDAELLKRCSHPIMLQVIQRITNNLWRTFDLPKTWGNSSLKTLWKGKSSKKDPSKYRGLSIGSTVCKLVVNIILERLRPWYEKQISDEQNGFRSNCGTTDGIYTIKRVHQISHRKTQPLFLLFVDLSAAFDHIPRKWLFDSINLRFSNNQNPCMMTILKTLYQHTSLTYEEKTFDTTSGVRQGGPESPFLFNLYIDFVMRLFMEKAQSDRNIDFFNHKYRMNSNSFTRSDRISMRENRQSLSGSSLLPWCGYADDLVLFLQSKTSLQNATILLDCIFTKYGLTINVQKTESMILNHVDPVYPTTLISLRNVELSNVCEFKYLGAYLHYNQPNTGEKEINNRIQLAYSYFVFEQFHSYSSCLRLSKLKCIYSTV